MLPSRDGSNALMRRAISGHHALIDEEGNQWPSQTCRLPRLRATLPAVLKRSVSASAVSASARDRRANAIPITFTRARLTRSYALMGTAKLVARYLRREHIRRRTARGDLSDASEAIRSIRSNQKHTQRHSGALRSTQEHSGALRSTQKHSGALGSTQKHSEALRSTQKHSEVPQAWQRTR